MDGITIVRDKSSAKKALKTLKLFKNRELYIILYKYNQFYPNSKSILFLKLTHLNLNFNFHKKLNSFNKIK